MGVPQVPAVTVLLTACKLNWKLGGLYRTGVGGVGVKIRE